MRWHLHGGDLAYSRSYVSPNFSAPHLSCLKPSSAAQNSVTSHMPRWCHQSGAGDRAEVAPGWTKSGQGNRSVAVALQREVPFEPSAPGGARHLDSACDHRSVFRASNRQEPASTYIDRRDIVSADGLGPITRRD